MVLLVTPWSHLSVIKMIISGAEGAAGHPRQSDILGPVDTWIPPGGTQY